jgi:hypothetical protein
MKTFCGNFRRIVGRPAISFFARVGVIEGGQHRSRTCWWESSYRHGGCCLRHRAIDDGCFGNLSEDKAVRELLQLLVEDEPLHLLDPARIVGAFCTTAGNSTGRVSWGVCYRRP